MFRRFLFVNEHSADEGRTVPKRLKIYDFGTFRNILNFFLFIVVPSAMQHTKFLTSFKSKLRVFDKTMMKPLGEVQFNESEGQSQYSLKFQVVEGNARPG